MCEDDEKIGEEGYYGTIAVNARRKAIENGKIRLIKKSSINSYANKDYFIPISTYGSSTVILIGEIGFDTKILRRIVVRDFKKKEVK